MCVPLSSSEVIDNLKHVHLKFFKDFLQRISEGIFLRSFGGFLDNFQSFMKNIGNPMGH